MAETKYDRIFQDIKIKIEDGVYPFQELLPSEHTLIKEYSCARNTLRRAISDLSVIGYVQSIHGKGVRVIYQPQSPSQYSLGRIESFKEASKRNGQSTKTKVVLFTQLLVDAQISRRTSFEAGTSIYYVQRVRYLDGKALIIDHNYFNTDSVPGLTPEICEGSVYEYIEQQLNQNIVTTKRMVTVERVTALDEKYLELNDSNCVAVVSSKTYNANGEMFEFTQSRHRPDYFVFYGQAQRLK